MIFNILVWKPFLFQLQQRIKHWAKPVTLSLVSGVLSDLTRSRSDLVVENALLRLFENEVPNIMQNGGNYAKVKCVPPQPSPLGVKKLAKFIRRGIWVPGSTSLQRTSMTPSWE